jgi:hypothetical protein
MKMSPKTAPIFMEWLPLFQERSSALFEQILDVQVRCSRADRLKLVCTAGVRLGLREQVLWKRLDRERVHSDSVTIGEAYALRFIQDLQAAVVVYPKRVWFHKVRRKYMDFI